MAEQEAKQRRPFHESVIDAINLASSCEEMRCLAGLIKATKIPKGHDEIITAWNRVRKEMEYWEYEDISVPTDLLEQKQEAEKKAKEQVETATS